MIAPTAYTVATAATTITSRNRWRAGASFRFDGASMATAGYRREAAPACTKPAKSALTLRAVDLADHLRVVRSNWWKILIVAVIVGGLSYAYSRSQPKVYAADQLLSVASQDVTSAQTVDPNQIDFRASFYAAVGNTPAIAAPRRSRSTSMRSASTRFVRRSTSRRPTRPAFSR